MTIEEAGQIILENEPWHVCTKCAGQGWIRKTTPEMGDAVTLNENGKAITSQVCAGCQGSTGHINPWYARACQLLGMEVPKDIRDRARPWSDKMMDATASELQIPIGYITGHSLGPNKSQVRVQQVHDIDREFIRYAAAEYLYELEK
jgi:hypothetical protein